MKSNEYKKQIKSVMEQKELNLYEICECGNTILKNADSAELFPYFIKKVCEVRTERMSYISDAIKEKIKNSNELYGKIWDETLRIWLCKYLEQDEFYKKVWESIYCSPILDTDDAKIYALFSTTVSFCIPYYQPQKVMSMGNPEFSQYTEEMIDIIDAARSMLGFPFGQRTERASAILNLLEQCETREKQTVLMAHILDFTEVIGEMNGEEDESITD